MGFTGSPPAKTHLGSGVPLPNDGSRHHPGTAPPRSDVNAKKGSNPSPSASPPEAGFPATGFRLERAAGSGGWESDWH